jgi:hypothetical protein
MLDIALRIVKNNFNTYNKRLACLVTKFQKYLFDIFTLKIAKKLKIEVFVFFVIFF